MPRPSTARRKSKVKSQKSKELYSGFLRHFEWLLYLRRAVLVAGLIKAVIAARAPKVGVDVTIRLSAKGNGNNYPVERGNKSVN